MGRKIPTLVLMLFTAGVVLAQEAETERKSIHQSESEYYSTFKSAAIQADAEGLLYPLNLVPGKENKLVKKVLGWHPYWVASTAYQLYDYEALSHIAYFSYEVDTATGGYSSIHDWMTTPIISYAHERGTKVLLTVTNFGTARNTELLTDTVKQKFLVNTLITLLKNRNGDGVNFDLESVPATQRANLVSFVRRAVTMIKAQLPNAEISMATPAVDWSNAWDLDALADLCDYLIFMGYDYYWKGSTTAGPVAPLQGENYNVTRSISTYLSAGVPASKLMLGVPWYGYDWLVTSNLRKATVSTGTTGTARIYTAAMQIEKTYGHIFDNLTSSSYIAYMTSQWRQLWYDDVQSLGMKYEVVKQQNMAGIGIWALSYEGGSREMWKTIQAAFSVYNNSVDSVMNIYPNPATEYTYFEYVLTANEDVTIDIHDSRGRKIYTIVDGPRVEGYNSETINTQYLASGIYYITLRTPGSVITRKFVVIKR